MKKKKIIHALLMSIFATSLAFSSWQPVFAQSAQPISISGWFTIIWGDGQSGALASAYTLTNDSGQTSTLAIDEALLAPLGGVLALDRQRIKISGVSSIAKASEGSQTTIQVDSIALESPKETANAEAVSGSQPFISIMCKFQDVAAEPRSLAYFQNMYGNVYPGLDDYWRQISYLTANIAGSTAVGWYVLPKPRSAYIVNNVLDHSLAATDCTNAANPFVNFAPFKGINLMFNADLDGYAWGGSRYMTLDGVSKSWPMTWEPPWGYSDITVISHEMGHAFGLPHSSGTYGQTYDNKWDVMSDTWSNCGSSTSPTYGCLGQQTISYHKDILGWIPPTKKYTAASWNTNTTITLEQLALPQTANYLMAQIPINGSSTHFYTVEVRRRTGYDVKLPGAAVIIHEIDRTRIRPANVIDADGNGNTGDGGAMWSVGERFSDVPNGIYVKVVSATASGFRVSIHTPAFLRSVSTNDGWVLESGRNSSVGGAINSTGTAVLVGDDAVNRQYRSILHFDTSGLPDTAVITKATLKILKQGLAGTDPFTTHGILWADIRTPFFGASIGLQPDDFQATASASQAAQFNATPVNNWYTAILTNPGLLSINRTGATQLRLRFAVEDNNDSSVDYVSFYSGESATLAYRPQLVIQYYVP